jgi:hypothetical protein
MLIVTEGRSYLRTTAAENTAGKVSDKTKDQTDMMKLMTDMQKKTIRFTKRCQPA